ncbi:hypothetical protein H6P81_010919 [Aristolochia fimbriata]|uniref:Protein SERAC1 n=1 Tax=Aristolochia fimbriata TaxID=158543 RepID=A0AAV7ERA7_ARIFI|nr:hypothetical protein H6P81_010919 [Aristolochia fimbriata]
MIYRKWSLLITPPLIVGTLVSGTLVYNFFLGGNERFFKKIRETEQRSVAGLFAGKTWNASLSNSDHISGKINHCSLQSHKKPLTISSCISTLRIHSLKIQQEINSIHEHDEPGDVPHRPVNVVASKLNIDVDKWVEQQSEALARNSEGGEEFRNCRLEDVAWLSMLSELEIDLLVSLKKLVIQRANVFGSEEVIEKFDLKLHRSLGVVLIEVLKDRLGKSVTVEPSLGGAFILAPYKHIRNEPNFGGHNREEVWNENMLRLCLRSSHRRFLSPSAGSSTIVADCRCFSRVSPVNSLASSNNRLNAHDVPPGALLPHHEASSLSPLPAASKSIRLPAFLASLSLLCAGAVAGAVALLSSSDPDELKRKSQEFYAELEQSLEKSNDSVHRLFTRMRRTGTAAAVLWRSLRSVLSSANQEMRSGFELRVAALVADIVAASETRRAAIVGAGGGAVVDWLLETVASSRKGTQAESARALACLIADSNVCEAVLGRPRAVPNLLRFIFSFQPHRNQKQAKYDSLVGNDIYKGQSMLVAAIMDIITSESDIMNLNSFQPRLPGQADIADIAAVLQVVEEGGIHLEDQEENNDDDGGEGLQGIGMKLLGGTTVLGFSRTDGLLRLDQSLEHVPRTPVWQKNHYNSPVEGKSPLLTTPGLWDDLQREHVAVPFATWALANWALASDVNRSHIQELDRDGSAIMTALMAPERSVKWHASIVARVLLQDQNLPLTDSVPEWSSTLLSIISQASLTEDVPLAHMAFSAFLISLERCERAQKIVREKGLSLMRRIAKQNSKHKNLQEGLAKALELLSTVDCCLSLEESHHWSGILLRWICGKFSTDSTRLSAAKILSCILEDHGPAAVAISQGWLTVILTEILRTSKTGMPKGNPTPKTDKVKTQIDQSYALSVSQTAHELAQAVVNLAASRFGPTTIYDVDHPLSDFLSLEPFSGILKNIKKDSIPKFDAADFAIATLKGIKALTEICAEDSTCQNMIVEFGVLHLLRRYLLRDDYEKLAATEAYDASRILDNQDQTLSASDKASLMHANANESAQVRVPPTAHIRKHAARLLLTLSVMPKVQEAIIGDAIWCKWLEDCANGSIAGCNDPKIQSYARAILLNVLCDQQEDENVENADDNNTGGRNQRRSCPKYTDRIFLMSPELPHWRCPDKNGVVSSEQSSFSLNKAEMRPHSMDPPIDIVFVHGLRGGPFKTWRITEDKASTTSKSGLVEKIDQEAGKEGTCWPREWLASDFPHARIFTVKYKTNLTQWSGASLPLQEVSSMLLKKLDAAGIGSRPVVFVTHSLGGLVVKQMLHQAKTENLKEFLNNTLGVVFYSCPHFGSRLADMPWRMGLVFRPAPTVGDLRSGSPRLVDLNDFLRYRYNKGLIDVLSFSETKVTPIVEGYGGWAFRLEIVPIESAYPGFGELVVLDATDHINSCKPVSRTDLSYSETLAFLEKLTSYYRRGTNIPQ